MHHRLASQPLIDNEAAADTRSQTVSKNALAHALGKRQNGRFFRGNKAMANTESELRQLILIYCLDRMPDGSYVALNRRYKPVGFNNGPMDFVKYEDFPVRFKFKRALSARQIAALSYKGDTNAERIYMYGDGCIPTSSDADWSAYSARLQRLSGYKVVH
jgi:hypothetical protein